MIKEKKKLKSTWGDLFNQILALLIGVFLAIAQQFTGINAIIYYFIDIMKNIVKGDHIKTSLVYFLLLAIIILIVFIIIIIILIVFGNNYY